MTIVVFRKFEGEIIALFPNQVADKNGNILSYQHIGQHGASSRELLVTDTIPATVEEYKPLLEELISVGYDDLFPMSCLYEILSDERLDELWGGLGDVTFDEDEDCDLFLSEDFYIWSAGTTREDIWHWFDEHYSGGLGARHF